MIGNLLVKKSATPPFRVCDTENFSGTKKRESKSEAFKENPFSHEFICTPSAEGGNFNIPLTLARF